MDATGNPAHNLTLDAGRNNPFLRSSRSGQSGFSRKVSSIAGHGDVLMNDGALVTGTAGQITYLHNAEEKRFYTGDNTQIPSQLRARFKEPLSHSIRSKYKDGSEKTFNASGTLDVLRREKLSTPAGQFMAWRIQRVVRGTDDKGHDITGQKTLWYVPEINNLVARERTTSSVKSGKAVLKIRVDLQSFKLTDANAMNSARANLAQAVSQGGGVAFSQVLPTASTTAANTSGQPAIEGRSEELLASIAFRPGCSSCSQA